METYPVITDEQKNQVMDLFYSCNADFEFKTRKDGYYFTITQMYDYVEFKDGISALQGFMKIANILECKDGDEVRCYASRGCETCDYGSSYELELKFW
jgi:hypothetical protein